MPTVFERFEGVRGSGRRKPGGIYLVCDGPGSPCDKLPMALTVCPCCHGGIKQSRGFTWVNCELFRTAQCLGSGCGTCPIGEHFSQNIPRMGLMWVGKKFYPTADHFTREAGTMGVSKRISQIPKDFVAGATWIALAHPQAVQSVGDSGELVLGPGVFRLFRPDRIEYVVSGLETEEQLTALEKRGLALVRVSPLVEPLAAGVGSLH